MRVVDSFHGAHVAAAQSGCMAIDWTAPVARCSNVRVRSHTCECASELFELCQAGGLLFIRRTLRKAGADVVHESGWVVSAVAERLWELLLRGQAR